MSLSAGQTSELTVLRRAIAVLQHAHDELAALYGDAAPVGRCTFFGEWGRCKRTADHPEGDHLVPTQEQWQATQDDLAAARRQRRRASA